ncbi:MAG: hypothetical protein FXF54_05410 [Kosmotoga sp.]|nr:MAG: hypothetical protein FXF54_05410 [Kosmotoga sp.]
MHIIEVKHKNIKLELLPTDLIKNNKRLMLFRIKGKESAFISLCHNNEFNKKVPISSKWTEIFAPNKNKIKFKLEIDKKNEVFSTKLPTVKQMKFHVLMFSHVDYGYTSPVSEVWKKQAQYTKQALKFFEQSKCLDTRSRFRWNIETTWALKAFLEYSTIAEKIKIYDLVKKGVFDIGSIYLHHYTDLAEYEELYRAFECVRELKKNGLELKSCFLSDVPGVSEGFLDILAINNIKYLFLSVNNFMAPFLAYTNLKTPFIWKTDNGNNILVWFTEDPKYAYIEGYKYLSGDFEEMKKGIIEKMLSLDEKGFDLPDYAIPMAIDNVPPIYKPVELIERWNKEFDNPVIKTSTVTSFFKQLEENKDRLKKVTGNFNGWWTSNILSYPRENSLSKETYATLHEAAMLDCHNGNYLNKEIQTEFERLSSFDEHSGGGGVYKSEDTFEILEAVKEGFGRLYKAYHNSEKLIAAERSCIFPEGDDLILINPQSFSRNSIACYRNRDLRGREVIVKDNASGKKPPAGVHGDTLYFGPVSMESFSYKSFSIDFLENNKEVLEEKKGEFELENSFYRIKLDQFGNIVSIFDLELNSELVESDKTLGKILIARQKVNPIDNLEDAPKHDELYTGKSSEMLIEDYLPGLAKYFIKKTEVGSFINIEKDHNTSSPIKKTIFLPRKKKEIYLMIVLDYLFDIGPSDFLFAEWCLNSAKPIISYTSPGKIEDISNQISGSGKDALTVLDAISIRDDEKTINLALKGINLFDVGKTSPFRFRKTIQESSNIYLRLLNGNMQNKFASPYSNGKPYEFSIKMSSGKEKTDLNFFGRDYRFQMKAFKAKSEDREGKLHYIESSKNVEVSFLDDSGRVLKILLKECEGKNGSIKITDSRMKILSICKKIDKPEFVKENKKEISLGPFETFIVNISNGVNQ